MKVVVCVKQVGTLGDDVEFSADGVDPDYLDFSLNEWDACALEEALRLRERAEDDGEVVVVTAGDEQAEEVLVRCLAMGADRAVRVELPSSALDAMTVSRALAVAIAPEEASIVLCGAQSSDVAQGATGAALAGLLDLPCVAVVTRLDYNGSTRVAIVHRELEGGAVDVVEVTAPAVFTVQTGINEPRYVTLRAIHRAQDVPIAVIQPPPAGAVDASHTPGFRVTRLGTPARSEAQFLGGGPADVARRIAELVREALR